MVRLSHEQAREFVQQTYLAEEDRLALRQHLSTCDECRAYAATHVHLLQQLSLRAARAQPTAAQRAAFLAAARENHAAPRSWRLLTAVGGLAALLFMVIASWLVVRAARPMMSQPVVPPPLSTLLAPFLPQTTPTAPPTEPAATPAATLPMPTGTPDPRGRYVIDTVPAPSLAGNVIGEPLEQQVTVYLPPSYDGGNRRYPVVYALMLLRIPERQTQAEEMDQAGSLVQIAMGSALLGDAKEMIVVAIDSVSILSTPNYFLDSPVMGNWEAFIAGDLVTYIDANYRTLPAADSRGLYAERLHGLGGLSVAMRHTDVFSALYLNRPDIIPPDSQDDIEGYFMSDPVRSGIISFIGEARTWPADTAVAQMRDRFLTTYAAPEVKNAVTYGIAFAPNIQSGAPFFDYPYAAIDGPPDAGILQKWETGPGDIPDILRPYEDALKRLDIVIVVEDNSERTVPAYLSEQLFALGVKHTFWIRPHSFDVADSTISELSEQALPLFFSQTLAFD
jgi:hypothetical protein